MGSAGFFGSSIRALFACLLLALAASTPSCAPQPETVACSNDGQCRDRGENFNYCLENRCVECVGNSRCKRGFVCDEGFCTLK